MKNQITHLTIPSYSNPELDGMVSANHSQSKADAQILGKTDAIVLKPPIIGGNLRMYTETITNRYNIVLATVNDKLQSHMQIRLGGEQRSSSASESVSLQKQVITKEAEISIEEKKVPNKPVVGVFLWFILGLFLTVGLVLSEIMYLIASLQVIVSTYYRAALLGTGLTIAIGTIGTLAEIWISRTFKSVQVRRSMRTILGLLLVLAFVAMGTLRKQYVKDMEGVDSPVWVFVSINLILFFGLFLVTEIILGPAIPELKEALAILKAKRKLAHRRSQLVALNRKLAENRSVLEASLQHKMMVIAYHVNLEELIERQYMEAMTAYKRGNIDMRADGVPECFEQEPAPLKFFTRDIQMGGPSDEK